MRLSEFIEYEANERAERRRLAEEKSYEILDRLEGVGDRFADVANDGGFGSVSPSIFVGRSGYPEVSTGLLSPVGNETDAARFATSGEWYAEGVSIGDVFERRTSLLNASQSTPVETNVHDAWDGFLGVQREVAIADRPVGVEVGLNGGPELDLGLSPGDVSTPTGPRAPAREATLTENPHVPRPVQKTLEDDDWAATGAMNYLYNRGFDVYEINTILSAGALGQRDNRRLVPTRWSITAVDDTVGQFLRGKRQDAPSVDTVQVFHNEYLGNSFWVILAPGNWEFELVEFKAPGSVWNPDPEAGIWLASDYEGNSGRTSYVEQTAGAYYAARLAVLEHLDAIGRQAKVLVLRHVSDDYWGPVGVWQVREAIRHAFDGERGESESFDAAVREIADRLPVSLAKLRRQSTLAAGRQSGLDSFI
ncbi:MAG: DNA repair protein NreA [Halohasta sp.]